MAKTYRRDVTKSGGRSGEEVLRIVGPPDSYILGGADRVFETDANGRVIRDITPVRFNVRRQDTSPEGIVHESMDKTHRAPTPADFEILRKMGVLK